jgi:hypothetical protein
MFFQPLPTLDERHSKGGHLWQNWRALEGTTVGSRGWILIKYSDAWQMSTTGWEHTNRKLVWSFLEFSVKECNK